jgi:hypothetical protein
LNGAKIVLFLEMSKGLRIFKVDVRRKSEFTHNPKEFWGMKKNHVIYDAISK